VAAHSPR